MKTLQALNWVWARVAVWPLIYGLGVLLQGLATLGQVTPVPDLGVTQSVR